MDETEAKEQALELGLNASEVISGDELTAKLREGRPLRVKPGWIRLRPICT